MEIPKSIEQYGKETAIEIFNDVESVTPALYVVALAGEHLSLGLPFLLLQYFLLSTYPAKSGNYCQPDSLVAGMHRYGDTNAAMGGINGQVQILDILADDVHGNATDFDLLLSSHS